MTHWSLKLAIAPMLFLMFLQGIAPPQVVVANWPAVGIAMAPVIGIPIVQIFTYMATIRAGKVAVRTEQKVDDTHALVNSGNQKQLELIVKMAKRLAAAKDATDDDVAAYHEAQKALADHLTKQAIVDDRSNR